MKKISLSLLCCVCLLTACSAEQGNIGTQSSSSMQPSSSSSSQAPATSESTAQKVEKSAEQTSANTSEEKGTEPSSSAETKPSASPSSSSIVAEAISSGDYSSIAGTWVNSKGEQLTIEKDGKARFAESTEDSILAVRNVTDQVIHADIATGPYSAAVKIIPAGVEDPYYANVDTRDRIVIGHDVTMYDAPFYRQ